MSDDELGVVEEMATLAADTSKPAAVIYGYGFRP
jgi:hypothetical protein